MRFFYLLMVLVGLPVAMPAAALDELLAKMDAAAPKFSTMSADMSRVSFTKVLDEKSTETGTMRLKRQSKEMQVLLNFVTPDPKVVALRGRKAEMYLPKLRTVQEYDLGKQSSLVDQFLMLGFGTTGRDLKQNYDLKLVGDETIAGQNTVHLQLNPKNSAVKEKLKGMDLWMSAEGTYPVQQKFDQPSGDYNLVTYTNAKLNVPLADNDLKLVVPKGTKRETPQK